MDKRRHFGAFDSVQGDHSSCIPYPSHARGNVHASVHIPQDNIWPQASMHIVVK